MSSFRERIKAISFPGQISPGQAILIFCLFVLGLVASFLIPVGGGSDEEQHLRRTWEMSALYFIPNSRLGPEMPVPAIFADLTYRRMKQYTTVEPDFFERYGKASIDENGWIYDDTKTRSVYSPMTLLPQSMVMRYLGRKYDLPFLTIFYASRTVGLAIYFAFVYLAVRLIPFGKWTLLIVAAAPTAMFQAATITADPISNGVGLLFISGTLAVSMRREIRWREWGFLFLMIALTFLVKLNFFTLAVLPFLLLLPGRFKKKSMYWLLLIATFALFFTEIVGWNLLAYPDESIAFGAADPIEQLVYILTNPITFIWGVIQNFFQYGLGYLKAWTAVYAFNYWSVPGPTFLFFWLALIASLFVDRTPLLPTRRTRLVLIFVWILSYLATLLLMQLVGEAPGSEKIRILQGRYFSALLLLLLLALVNPPFFKNFAAPKWILTGGVILSTLFFVSGIYLAYHVICGTSYYSLGYCYQPQYKNWAPNSVFSPPITDNVSLTQEFVPVCDGLTRLRFWADSTHADPTGATELIVHNVETGETLFELPIRNVEIPQRDWQILDFNPDWNSSGKHYTLVIRNSGAPDSNGPVFSYTILTEYEAGRLYENETPLRQDLFFQYGCRAGLKKLISSPGPQ